MTSVTALIAISGPSPTPDHLQSDSLMQRDPESQVDPRWAILKTCVQRVQGCIECMCSSQNLSRDRTDFTKAERLPCLYPWSLPSKQPGGSPTHLLGLMDGQTSPKVAPQLISLLQTLTQPLPSFLNYGLVCALAMGGGSLLLSSDT